MPSRIGAFDGEILGAGVGNYRRLFIDEGRGVSTHGRSSEPLFMKMGEQDDLEGSEWHCLGGGFQKVNEVHTKAGHFEGWSRARKGKWLELTGQ